MTESGEDRLLTFEIGESLFAMPIAGVLYAIFVGWWVSREVSLSEIGLEDGAIFKLWMLLVRIVAPLAIAIVFVFNLT